MLAYIFWHWATAPTDLAAHETTLGQFHRRLAEAPLGGFRGSATFRVDRQPWAPPADRWYEDWYLLEGSAVLDPLNEIAVSGDRKPSHDDAARQTVGGTGGLYRVRVGEATLENGVAHWFPKPAGMAYDALYAALDGVGTQPGCSLWRRQMVLGPAPELCLVAPAEMELPVGITPLRVQRRRLS